MKKYVLFSIVLLFTYVCNAQVLDKFIIGVDWLSPIPPVNASTWGNCASQYLDTAKSFNINFGTLDIMNPNINIVKAELQKAAQRNIKIELNDYTLPGLNGTKPRRWMYQIEENYDFNSHSVGRSGRNNIIIDSVELHWSLINTLPGISANNYYQVRVASDAAGYIAEEIKTPKDQPDGSTYYVKVRVRFPTVDNSHREVLKVIVNEIGSLNKMEGILYSDAITQSNVWKEVPVLCYIKTSAGPVLSPTPISNVVSGNPDFTGQPDYLVNADSTPYELKIYWYGTQDCDIDYVVIEDYDSFELHNGGDDYKYSAYVNNYINESGLNKIKIWDEPEKENLLPVRYANRLLKKLNMTTHPEKCPMSFHYESYDGHNQRLEPQRYLAQSEAAVNRCDFYTNENGSPAPGDIGYLNDIQSKFTWLSTYCKNEINSSENFRVPFWYQLYATSWGAYREPSVFESKATANLAICYGAKAIQYFMFSIPFGTNWIGASLLNDQSDNPTPRYIDSYGNLKWSILKTYNAKLLSIGDELMKLTWQKSYFIHSLASPNDGYIKYVNIYKLENGQYIDEDETEIYAQVGVFKQDVSNNNLEHFYVVNRRTMPTESRKIRIEIDKSSSIYNNWKISEVGTPNSWVVNKTGYFETVYDPAEGKLFKMEPVMIAGGELKYNETLPDNYSGTAADKITIDNGAVLTINKGANISLSVDPSSESIKPLFDVNGIINCLGLSTSKIHINNGYIQCNPASSFNVNNTVINCPYYGITADQALSGNISNSEIYGANIGIYLYDQNYSPNTVTIDNNNIHNNFTGILLTYSSPVITNNTVTNNTNGIIIQSHSSPHFGGLMNYGRNTISNNSYGIHTTNYSNPVLGVDACEYECQKNSFARNTYYHLSADNNCFIPAEQNYWGTAIPDSSLVLADNSSYIDYDPYLNSIPQLLKKSSGLPEEKDFNKAFSIQDGETPSIGILKINDYNPEWNIGRNLKYAGKLILLKKNAVAGKIIKHVLENYADSSQAYYALDLLWQSGRGTDIEMFKDYIKLFKDSHNKKNVHILSELVLAGFDKERLTALDRMLNQYKETGPAPDIYFNKFLYTFNTLKDTAAAKSIFDIMSGSYPKSSLTETAGNLLSIGKNKVNKDNSNNTSSASLRPANTELNIYPNPFNPATNISYTLADNGNVKITLYSILGEQIKVLEDGVKEKGLHTYILNMEELNLASGRYFVTMKYNNNLITKKMLYLK